MAGAVPRIRIQRPTYRGPVDALQVTPYERVASGLISALILLAVVTFCLFVAWLGSRTLTGFQPVDVEYIQQVGGGLPDGIVGESKQLDSPEFREVAEESQIMDEELTQTVASVLDVVAERQMELADPALTNLFEQQKSGGKMPGKGVRHGRGIGPGLPGYPPWARWEIRYPEGNTIETYAKILEFFKIDVGILTPNNTVTYLVNPTNPKLGSRVGPRDAEQRMYMTWKHGRLREADEELLGRAGIPAANKIILHFFNPDLEQVLLQLERKFAGRDASRIRKTRFAIQRSGAGYEFVVIDQVRL